MKKIVDILLGKKCETIHDKTFILLLRLLSTVLWQMMNSNMNFNNSTGFFANKLFLRAFSHTSYTTKVPFFPLSTLSPRLCRPKTPTNLHIIGIVGKVLVCS
jgi:hypothetical protein